MSAEENALGGDASFVDIQNEQLYFMELTQEMVRHQVRVVLTSEGQTRVMDLQTPVQARLQDLYENAVINPD